MNLRFSSLLRPILNIHGCNRSLSSVPGAAVKLSFDKYNVKPELSKSDASPPVLILHGLFGSRQNWRGISKRLNADLNPYRPVRSNCYAFSIQIFSIIKCENPFQVYAIDTRNHGLSPRSPEHHYDLLAADLKELYSQEGITKAALLGHSMGGRVMINFALKYVREIR